MKYTEYYEIMRDNYSIIVPKTMNQNTKFVQLQYSNGAKKYEGNYITGKKHGLHKAWYQNNQLKYEGSYVNGMKDGLHKAWYEGGQVMYQAKKDGLHEMWHQNGKIMYEGYYKNIETPEGIINFINIIYHQFGLPTEIPVIYGWNFIPLLLAIIISESIKFFSTLFSNLSKTSLKSKFVLALV